MELEGVATYPGDAEAWKIVDVSEGKEIIAGFGVWEFSERVCYFFSLIFSVLFTKEGSK